VQASSLRAFLKALKYSRRRDLPDRILLVLEEAAVLEDEDLLVILTYLDKGPFAINDNVMVETLERLVPDRKERIMGWLTQPYYEKGKAEGKAEGEAKGQAKTLTRFLEKRFGIIPITVRQRIFSADAGTIDIWVERAVDAPDLQSVFGFE
jgi:flagellar biosynthesis/type III secretory pathway protein FliH